MPPRIDVAQALQRLAVAIPTPVCEIDHKDPWTLLIGTILSAQSTDKMRVREFPRAGGLFGAHILPLKSRSFKQLWDRV